MDDLDDVRAFLGYDKINIYGGSYGTRAGLVYLRQHGDRVRAAILDGVAPTNMRLPLFFPRDVAARARPADRGLRERPRPATPSIPNLHEPLARADASAGKRSADGLGDAPAHRRARRRHDRRALLVANVLASTLYITDGLVADPGPRSNAPSRTTSRACSRSPRWAASDEPNMSIGMQLVGDLRRGRAEDHAGRSQQGIGRRRCSART